MSTDVGPAAAPEPRAGGAWLVVRGLLAIALGFVSILFPFAALLSFTLVFAGFAFADGVMSLIGGVAGMAGRRGEMILRGVVGIAAGLVFLVMPMTATLATAMGWLLLVSGWSIVTGGLEIATAIRHRKVIRHEWLMVLSGLISILLGVGIVVMLMIDPLASILSAAWLIGLFALSSGFVLTALGFRMRAGRRPEGAAAGGSAATA